MSLHVHGMLRLGAALVLLSGTAAVAQTALPQLTIKEPRAAPKPAKPKPPSPRKAATAPKRPVIRTAARRPASPAVTRITATPGPAAPPTSATPGASANPAAVEPVSPMVAAARAGEAKAQATRAEVEPKGAANSYTIGKQAVDALPQGSQTNFDRVVLQAPGVSQDSAASGDFHVRNEHANVQYRINGILLPDGVSGFSQVLDSSFIRTLTLIDGALPAEYGLHTAGILDIQARDGADNPGTTVSLYGGSLGTIIPTIETSGVYGRWDYFFTGRYVTNQIGIENPIHTLDAIHDETRQGRYFAYASGVLEDDTRLTFMSGATIAKYQIPNTPGQTPAFTAYGVTDFDSTLLNENQLEHSIFNIIAAQKTIGPFDGQISYFQRYSTLHFIPDPIGDLVFNGIASDVTRTSLVNGLQSDNAYHLDPRQTVRFGFTGQVEQAQALNNSTVLPLDPDGNPIDMPFSIDDAERKTGFVGGVYVQDEYKLTNQITVNGGLRFDAMQEYVAANQLSPRLGIVYKPFETTTFHAGYARYFTPPELALSAPTPLAAYANTTGAPGVNVDDPVRPERSNYFDAGVNQAVTSHLDVGLDAYYKLATNLLDDGQFGQALVLTAFNYAKAYNDGVELTIKYQNDGFHAYGNVAVARQRATQVTSNQDLFDPGELAYINTHYIYTDHDQTITASGGVSYTFHHTTLSTDMIYGSGLRDDFANVGTVAPYATFNVGASHDFELIPGAKPTTLRLAVVNLFDHSYEIRDGSGIGVFAPQYGARRGLFAGLSQRF